MTTNKITFEDCIVDPDKVNMREMIDSSATGLTSRYHELSKDYKHRDNDSDYVTAFVTQDFCVVGKPEVKVISKAKARALGYIIPDDDTPVYYDIVKYLGLRKAT